MTGPCQGICAVIAFQIPKYHFQALELREFFLQHVQHLRIQDTDDYGQALQSPLLDLVLR
jgi:hypothetical protein